MVPVMIKKNKSQPVYNGPGEYTRPKFVGNQLWGIRHTASCHTRERLLNSFRYLHKHLHRHK